MKKITTTVTKIALLTALTITSTLACTEAEAFDKMMAIGRVQQAMGLETPNDDKEKKLTKMLYSLNTDMEKVYQDYIMTKRYPQACSAYDEIVQKYNIDMDKASKDMITMEQLKKAYKNGDERLRKVDGKLKVNVNRSYEDILS